MHVEKSPWVGCLVPGRARQHIRLNITLFYAGADQSRKHTRGPLDQELKSESHTQLCHSTVAVTLIWLPSLLQDLLLLAQNNQVQDMLHVTTISPSVTYMHRSTTLVQVRVNMVFPRL